MPSQKTLSLVFPHNAEIAKKEKEMIKRIINDAGLSPSYGGSGLMRLMFRALLVEAGYEDEGLFLPSSRGKPSLELQEKLKRPFKQKGKRINIKRAMRLLWEAARVPGQEVQKQPPKKQKEGKKKTRKS